MQARDVMVSPVITVKPSTSVRDVAKTLLARRISAMPVVDDDGKLVGMISEGDLLHRAEAGTEAQHPWWLRTFLGDETLAAEYVKAHGRKAADIMTTRIISASPDTPLHEIAALLEKNAIKRVPIVSNGQLVGIVSRANLIQAVASARVSLDVLLSDTAIREKLLTYLRQQAWAHAASLNVTVSDGIVDLWGVVQSDAESKAIRVSAESIPGVRFVQDNLVTRQAMLF